MKNWKIVQVTMLVREDDAEELHATYGRFTEHDELNVGAYIETRDVSEEEGSETFAEIIEYAGDFEEEEV